MREFIESEPGAEKYFRPWVGSKEFIECRELWCLYLGEAEFGDLNKLPLVMDRVRAVRDFGSLEIVPQRKTSPIGRLNSMWRRFLRELR